MPNRFRRLCTFVLLCACAPAFPVLSAPASPAPKIGVLLVNHGSHSPTWRASLLELEDRVRPVLDTRRHIAGLKTAFMEYTEPSIATRLKEFDAEGFTHVVLVPIFLTVSAHTFDDIPTIIGRKTDPAALEMLRLERIERYTPKAATILAPNLDFPGILRENLLRRARALSHEPAQEALVLIAYGDETYEREWTALLDDAAAHVKENTGIAVHTHGWCGHLVHYDPARTTDAINAALAERPRALVLPVLVAHDEYFQVKIIGGGISRVPGHDTRVTYRPDSILPEPAIERWVIAIATEHAAAIAAGRTPAPLAAR